MIACPLKGLRSATGDSLFLVHLPCHNHEYPSLAIVSCVKSVYFPFQTALHQMELEVSALMPTMKKIVTLRYKINRSHKTYVSIL